MASCAIVSLFSHAIAVIWLLAAAVATVVSSQSLSYLSVSSILGPQFGAFLVQVSLFFEGVMISVKMLYFAKLLCIYNIM